MDGLSTLSGSTLWQPIRPGGEGDALNAVAGETVSLIALLSVLAWAVTRPHGWPEAIAAVPAAVILIAAGVIPADRAADDVAGNINPVGRVYYSASTLLCVPNALSQSGGYALGAQAGEAAIRQVVTDAGFTRFQRAAETPFNIVYEVRP